MAEKLSLPKNKIKVLLLENIHKNAVELFKRNGYGSVELIHEALDAEALKKKIKNVHILGIRSRTTEAHSLLTALSAEERQQVSDAIVKAMDQIEKILRPHMGPSSR